MRRFYKAYWRKWKDKDSIEKETRELSEETMNNNREKECNYKLKKTARERIDRVKDIGSWNNKEQAREDREELINENFV